MDDNTPHTDLADFDKVGTPKPQPTPEQQASAGDIPAAPTQPAAPVDKPGKTREPINPRRLVTGCGGFMLLLFLILIAAMVMGLTAGEDAIRSFGFDPTSFKNWTIGLVSLVFGTIAISFVMAIVLQVIRALFADEGHAAQRRRAVRTSAVLGLLLTLTLMGWFFVYSSLNQFLTEPEEFLVEILTEPRNTLGLTSPITLNVSGELITRRYARTHDIVSYQWDQDSDGTIDATGERTQLYFQDGGNNNGVYTITLRATLQPRGADDAPVQIEEYQKRVSIATQEMYGQIVADRESGSVPLTVRFDGSRIRDPHNAAILNYQWDLNGDGIADFDGPQFSRAEWTFDTVGEHEVSLTVTSEDFAADGITRETKTFTKTIVSHQPGDLAEADAIIVASPRAGTAPLTVNFDASNSGRSTSAVVDSYEWTINEGADKFFGMRGGYTFDTPGNYLVTLRVLYANGVERTDTVTITVADTQFAPEAVISTVPGLDRRTDRVQGPAPLTVTLDGTRSTDPDNNIVRYEWDTDADGFYDTDGSRVDHVFRDEGEYRVRLRVTDADDTQSETEVIVFVSAELPTISFGADQVSGTVPLTVQFDASGSRMPGKEIVSYSWDFGDGSPPGQLSSQSQISHIYDRPGVYTATLVLHAADGTTAAGQQTITITDIPLAADFRMSRSSGAAPLAVSFDASASTGDIARYSWSFGDGGTSTDESPIHTFVEAGDYLVTLRVFGSSGSVAVHTAPISVR